MIRKYLFIAFVFTFILTIFSNFFTLETLGSFSDGQSHSLSSKTAQTIRNVKSTNYKVPEAVPFVGPKLVVIDPGHGGKDPGALFGSLQEKDIVLDISLRVQNTLKALNIPTYITRSDDRFLELKERINTANQMNAALFVSIHNNSMTNPFASGIMTLYYPSETLASGFLTEKEFALTIQNHLEKSLNIFGHGIIERPNLAVLRYAKMPSLVLELGFLSNSNDRLLLASEEFREKASKSIAEAIQISVMKISVE
ncbi:MAG: N-acetylmuramoyl-L-alanine amidase [Clostridia bacterium]|nr:N-acetylmuramoyl-L-alanine amidase [Clostridia bacterium]